MFVTSGHTHRHRRRRHGTAVITEVGSPKDFPGTWAGYVVHEGGIRQVVRRIARPDVLRWTERSAAAAFGLWCRWSPGTLDDRCFAHTWPTADVRIEAIPPPFRWSPPRCRRCPSLTRIASPVWPLAATTPSHDDPSAEQQSPGHRPRDRAGRNGTQRGAPRLAPR